jgi:hypothetical protein
MDVQQAVSEKYISILDLYKPQIDDQFYMKFVREDTICEYLEMMKMVAVSNSSYEHWEEKRISSYISAAATQSNPGAGVAVTITLSTKDHRFSGTKSMPQVGELVFVMKSKVSCQITAVDKNTPNAHTFTIAPQKLADNIGAVAIGDSFIITGNAYAPGTGQPGGLTPDVSKVTNKLQIMKATYEEDGSSWGNETQVDFGGGKYIHVLGEDNTVRLFKYRQEMNVILTPQTDNTALTDIRTSEGLIPFIKDRGGVVEPYTAGTWNYDKHKIFTKKLDKRMIPVKEFMWRCGIEFREEVNTFAQDLTKNGGVVYGAFQGNNELGMQLGFNSINDLGYNHHFSTYRLFNDGEMLGCPGSEFPGNAIVMPYGYTKDPQTKKSVPYARMRVKNSGGYNREYKFWPTGVGPNVATNQEDKMQFNYLTEKGAEWFCADHWGYIERGS